jgi:DNA-binding response OmpR family regulator
MNPQVLIVDDDPVVRDLLCTFLQSNGFDASVLHDGTHLQRRLERERPSVVVLDIMMPNTDGLRALTALRAAGDDIPVIFVTARGTVADRIVGLSLGADDYLTKPFSPRELLARIRAVLRRRQPEVQQGRPEGIRAYRFDGWELNLNTRRLKAPAGKVVRLSNGEFSLLVVLLGAANRVLTRDQLLDMSRLHGDDVYNRSVNTQILRLRRKLEGDPAKPRYICTERGAGYVFNARVDIIY